MFNRLKPCEHINQEELAQKIHLSEETTITKSKERGFFVSNLPCRRSDGKN
jgi:DNA-binding XRE family transcriptional regulator